MGFSNEAVGGINLVRAAIRSPNYQAGVSGWTINEDGTASFNSVTLTGGSLIVSSSGQGVFVYAGTPTTGNLIVSIASAAGTDAFGNAYPEGLQVSQGEIDAALINGAAIVAGSISAGSIGNSQIVNSAVQGGTISESVITFDSGGGALLVYSSTTTTMTTNGSGNFTVPAGVTAIEVECWGGGAGGAGGGLAGGANSGGYGGGGGAYSKVNSLAVTPLAVLPYVVGAGGAGGAVNSLGTSGGTTTFNSTGCKATGGTAATATSTGRGGQATAGVGDIRFSGGNSATATGSGASGGGGSAGPASNGNAGSANTGFGSASGGAAVAGGGSGGAGGSQGFNGSLGALPGGGSGGGGGGGGTGANGRNGQVRVTYQSGTTLIASISGLAGTDSMGNSYPAGVMVFGGDFVAVDPTSTTGPEVWHAITAGQFGTGWSASSPYSPSVRKLPDGDVELGGAAFNASAAVGQTIFTLAAAYWPPNARTLICWGRTSSVVCAVTINTNGTVVLTSMSGSSTNHTIQFDGIRYSTAAI